MSCDRPRRRRAVEAHSRRTPATIRRPPPRGNCKRQIRRFRSVDVVDFESDSILVVDDRELTIAEDLCAHARYLILRFFREQRSNARDNFDSMAICSLNLTALHQDCSLRAAPLPSDDATLFEYRNGKSNLAIATHRKDAPIHLSKGPL